MQSFLNSLLKPLTPRRWWPWSLIIGVVFLAVLLNYRPLHDPIAQDGSLLSVIARVGLGEMPPNRVLLESGAGMWRPMLYQILLNTLARTVGSELIFARMLGLVLGLLTAVLIGWLVILIKRHQSMRWWPVAIAMAAFLTNPFGRLGMLHLDIDTSVMPPILLILAGSAILLSHRFRLSTLILSAGFQALAFWAKLTTPLLVPLSLAFRLRLDRRNWSFLWIPATVLSAGGALYALSWAVYCSVMGYPFPGMFTRIAGVFTERPTAGKDIGSIFRHLIGLVYWFNPAFLVLWIACTWKLFRRRYNGQESRDLKLIAVISWGIMLGYMFIGGMTSTIPKYQYPAIAFMSVLIALVVVPSLKFSRLTLIVWGVAIPAIGGYYYALGDPLYRFFYDFRAYAWNVARSPALPAPYFLILFKDLLLVLLPVFVAGAVSFVERPGKRLARLTPWLILTALGYNLGLGVRQSQAPYVTTYSYGMQDADRVLERIKDGSHVLIYEGALLGPYNTKRLRFTALDFHGGVDAIAETIRSTEADYLLVGLAINTLDQLFALERSPELVQALQSRFLLLRIGDFILYDRQPQPNRPSTP